MTMKCDCGKIGGGWRRNAARVLAWAMLTAGIVFISACTETIRGTRGESSTLTIGSKLQIRKLVDRPWIPLGSSSNDLTPFLLMAGLLVVSALLMWKRPKCQWARRLVQTFSAAAFIIGIHPCGCMTRDLVLGVSDLGSDDLSAFKYMIVFATVGTFAAVVGRSFCGWLCPVGYAEELVAGASRKFWRCIDQGRHAAAVLRAAVFFAVVALLYALLIEGALDADFAIVYGGIFLAVAAAIVLGSFLRNQVLVKYLFGVGILAAILYAFYRTKPGTYSVVEYAMVFFVMGLTLIVLTVIGDDAKDRFFKKYRLLLWLVILGVYIYGLYNVGPMCLFFQGSTEWPVLISFGGVFLLSILISMAWCRYMCPEGVALGLLASRAGWQINRADLCCAGCRTRSELPERACTSCGVCTSVCPMHCIENGIRDRRTCIYCMKCVKACPENVLVLVNEIGGRIQEAPYPLPAEAANQEKPCLPDAL